MTLTASRGAVSASYTVLGRVSRHRIDADFGRLGHVSGRFLGRPFHPFRGFPLHKDCRGRPPVFEHGPFRGRIVFRGEHGYTRAATRRAPAFLARSFRRVCKPGFELNRPRRPGKGGGARLYLTELQAARRSGGRRTQFAAFGLQFEAGAKSESEPGLIVVASTEERRGRVAISRSTFAIGAGDGLLLTPPARRPIEATVALPDPYAGSARFRQPAPPAERWTGTLGVHLPGAGLVPLTGPGFHVGFCRAASVEKLERCERQGRRPAAESAAMRRALLALRRRVGG